MTGLGSNLLLLGIFFVIGVFLWVLKKAMCDEIDWGDEGDPYLRKRDD